MRRRNWCLTLRAPATFLLQIVFMVLVPGFMGIVLYTASLKYAALGATTVHGSCRSPLLVHCGFADTFLPSLSPPPCSWSLQLAPPLVYCFRRLPSQVTCHVEQEQLLRWPTRRTVAHHCIHVMCGAGLFTYVGMLGAMLGLAFVSVGSVKRQQKEKAIRRRKRAQQARDGTKYQPV